MRMPFSRKGSDDGLESIFTPLLDALFLMLVAIFAGYIVEVESQIPAPLELSSTEYFDSGVAKLKPESKEMLISVLEDSLGQRLHQLHSNGTYEQLTSINIEGYADTMQLRKDRKYNSNEELSYFRALNIYKIIDSLNSNKAFTYSPNFNYQDSTYADSLFLVGGYGERKLKNKKNPTARENRRILIRFVFDKNEN